MYVLMDIEWVQNKKKMRCPTQIAAMRVDECWRFRNIFYTRIQPPDESFCLWDHMAYTGGTADEYLSAPTLSQAAELINAWFREDDILCWWTTGSPSVFEEGIGAIPQEQLLLFPYLRGFLKDKPNLVGGPYHIADQLNIARYGSRHDSRSDVEMMRRVLWEICFPQNLLRTPVPEITDASNTYLRYVLDVETNRVHRRGCADLPVFGMRKEYPGLNTIVTKDCKPCICCAGDFSAARRERNRWIIENSEYRFIFSPNSDVFHTRDCKAVLSSSADVRGTMKYKTCIDKKRKPCKICKPLPPETEKSAQKKKEKIQTISISAAPLKSASDPGKHSARSGKRKLTAQEQRALQRLKQAQTERENLKDMAGKSTQEKEDLRILTQPTFAFWTAAGYGSFHLRHCGKLNALSNLKGFGLYEEAVRMGYRPCKQCKPSAKHNIEVSLPIYSRERKYETIELLTELCEEHGYEHSEHEQVFQIETPKGIWRIHTDSIPYRMEHINKKHTPGNTTRFHIQPRIFLSLTDAFSYIKKHDSCTTKVYNRNTEQD